MYRDDVEALAARRSAIAAEVDRLVHAHRVAGTALNDAKVRAKLPVLDNIRIASPCRADWNTMQGDDRVRHCGECNKNVYNLSNMTRDEAEALLLSRGHLCIRYYRRSDGTILLADDCPVGLRKRRFRRQLALSIAVVAGSVWGSHKVIQLAERPEKIDAPVEQHSTTSKISYELDWNQGGAPEPGHRGR